MEDYFAYIRVSTVKQGEKGVSLQEQRDAIQRYADRKNIAISRWFEERQTATEARVAVYGTGKRGCDARYC
tara:strand:- start:30738 stop:30950 length:213 start_codon:yes stop_codon:yes gene_type:complete